jgi:transcriptional regulator with GAF, ATPase, and Fis domain
MSRILWLRSAGRSDEVEQIEQHTGAKVVIACGIPSAWKEYLEKVQVMLIELPLPPDLVQEALITASQAPVQIPVLLYDPECTFDESLIGPPILDFQHVPERLTVNQLAVILERKLERAAGLLAKAAQTKEPWRELLVGESQAMRALHSMIRLTAPRRSTVLITGESGTGKEMVARAIHIASGRAGANLVPVNCAAIPENLVESELFGHVRGAYTGAVTDRAGRFEQAHRGTIFLDEIGEVPLDMQPKLLRVLQEREIHRVGSSTAIQVDARVIAASNRDLEQAVADKLFREDLMYRLNVVPIVVPPLRERGSDIPLLADHFIEKVCTREGLGAKTLSGDAVRRLSEYEWPGNVRQLEHTIEMAVTLSGERARLYSGDIQLPVPRIAGTRSSQLPGGGVSAKGEVNLEQTVGRVEQLLIQEALQHHGGNKAKAASSLGIPRTTLLYKLRNATAVA